MAAQPPDAYPVAAQAQTLDPEQPYKSIADSGILYAALQKSRIKWLTSMLPLFSRSLKSPTKAAQQVPQDAHTLSSLGRCDMVIGPHTFFGTKFYEVKWTGPAMPPPPLSPGQLPPMTPALTARLHQEAAKDALLESIMAKVQNRTASPAEVTAFTKYTQALHNSIQANTKPEPRKNAIVIEFRENQMERFILPTDFTWLSDGEKSSEGILTFSQAVLPTKTNASLSIALGGRGNGILHDAYRIECRLLRVTPSTGEALNRLKIKALPTFNEPPRSHLQLQVIDTVAVAAREAAAQAAALANVNKKSLAAKQGAATRLLKQSLQKQNAGKPLPLPGTKTATGKVKRKAAPGSNWGGVRKKGVFQEPSQSAAALRRQAKAAERAPGKTSPSRKKGKGVASDDGEQDPIDAIKAKPTARQKAKGMPPDPGDNEMGSVDAKIE